jgi:hypothetical protein
MHHALEKVLAENLKGIDQLEDLGVDGKIIGFEDFTAIENNDFSGYMSY